MLGNLFQGILLISCFGMLLSIFLLLIKPKTQKHFSSRWHYYIWIAVLVAMMLPIRFRMPEIPMPSAVQRALIRMEYTLQESFEEINPFTPKQEMKVDEEGRRVHSLAPFLKRIREMETREDLSAIAPVWFAIAVLALLVKFTEYMFFLGKIHRTTRPIMCSELSEFTERNVIVRTGAWVTSPLLLGVFRPTLLLPEKQMTESQLHNVLAHEMTHLKRNDMLLKWFVVLVKCVHWFNPMIYIIGKEIDQECEISCDMSVTEHMSKEEKMSYVDTILTFLQRPEEKVFSLTMGMADCKEQLKERFMCIKNRLVISQKMHVLARTAAIAFFAGVTLASGEMMCHLFPYLGEVDYYTSECVSCKEEVLYSEKDVTERLTWSDETGANGVGKEEELLILADTNGYQIEQFCELHFKCQDCDRVWTEQHVIGDPKGVDVYNVKVDRYGLILQ